MSPLWGRRTADKALRLFFATDLHGANLCFRKFLAAARVYEVDVLVLGGDVAGKSVVPVFPVPGGFSLGSGPSAPVVSSESDLQVAIRNAEDLGTYCVRMEAFEAEGLAEDDARVQALLKRAAARRLTEWIAMAEDRLAGTAVKCLVTGGNDDAGEILEALLRADGEHVVHCEDEIVRLPHGRELLSLGYSNPTPWQTPREVPEAELGALIDRLATRLENPESSIFNLHVPPVGSGLDRCPQLDTSTEPPTVVRISGEVVMGNAGSSAVREALARYQPVVSLHGHIHEARATAKIGRTLALNPGSEYRDGVLRGVIATISDNHVHHQFTSG